MPEDGRCAPEDIHCIHQWAAVLTTEGTYVNQGVRILFFPNPRYSLMDPNDASLIVRDRDFHLTERAGIWQPQP